MSLIKPSQLTVPQKTLRRVSDRAKRVAGRYETHPLLGIAAVPVAPAAKVFEEAFDASRNLAIKRGERVEKCNASARVLAVTLRARAAVLGTKHHFDASEFTPETAGPADVAATARRFVAFVESRMGTEPSALFSEAIEVISAQALVTEDLWDEAQRVGVEVQALEQTARDRALELHKELVAFRRALAAVVGRRHRDYQTLRYRRAPQDDETLEVVIDGAPPVGSTGEVSGDAASAGALRLAEVAAE